MAIEAEVFGKAMRDLRERRGLTQEKLAHAAGLTTNYLSDVERGRKVPSLTTVLQVSRALDCSPGELLAAFTPAVIGRIFRDQS